MSPEISFITAVHNGLDASKLMLETFHATVCRNDYEFIFVDDASEDDSRQYLSNLPAPFHFYTNRRTRGFAGANNYGVQKSNGRILVFLNNDLLFYQPWLEPMLDALEIPSVGAVGNIQYKKGKGLIDHAGMFFDQDGMARQARKNTRRIPPGSHTEWNSISGACMAIRRETFIATGGFDEQYRNGCEDVDLSIRLRIQGFRLLVANQSQICHVGGASPGRHDHDAENESRFLSLWQDTTSTWAVNEWPREYLVRYSRLWWKLNPLKALQACWLFFRQRQTNRSVIVHSTHAGGT
ncbi:MAG: glycosyltransferase [Opitutae bacterium]|jgi:O-antigen biosynthesis protein|nr:glycosyltransferase [Opitutae bacterium]